VSLPLQFVALMAATVGTFHLSVHLFGSSWVHPGLTAPLCEAIQGFALWVAPVLTAAIVCFLAARHRAALIWPIVGCVLIALLGAATNAEFNWSQAQPSGAISAGIGIPGRGPAVGLRFALTLFSTLVPYLWFSTSARARPVI
jgi:hypothetical protein